jgi:hypothetical protein
VSLKQFKSKTLAIKFDSESEIIMNTKEMKKSVKRDAKLTAEIMNFKSSAIDFFSMFRFNHSATKTVKVRAKKADTFVAAVYAAYIANKLTEKLYKEIAKEHNTALHRFKAYVAYFKANKYIVV